MEIRENRIELDAHRRNWIKVFQIPIKTFNKSSTRLESEEYSNVQMLLQLEYTMLNYIKQNSRESQYTAAKAALQKIGGNYQLTKLRERNIL